MKRLLIIAFSLLIFTTAGAKSMWGIRGGYNITNMSFSERVLSSTNRTGFYFGPTLKVNVGLGFGLDLSAIYDQRETSETRYVDEFNTTQTFPNLKRKTFSLPINVRYSFGLGSVLSLFVFAGPEFDFSLNKDIKETNAEYSWKTSTYSANLGFGVTLAKHLEVRANYNIPCGESGSFTYKHLIDDTVDGVNAKTGAWQIGAAVYF